MHNDNIYPLNGNAYRNSFAEAKERKVESDEQILEQLPVLQDVITHIDKQITFYDSVNSIADDVLVHPEQFMHVVAANKLTADNLRQERNYIYSKIKSLK